MIKLVEVSQYNEGSDKILAATFMVDGDLVPLKLSRDDSSSAYVKAMNIIKNGVYDGIDEDLYAIMSPLASAVKEISKYKSLDNNIEKRGNQLYFQGNKLEEELSKHLISMMYDDGTPKDEAVWKSYTKFLDNLYQNVSADVREQLFRWMKYENDQGHSFAITEDGCFVGYKGCDGTTLEPMSRFTGYAIVDGVEHNGHIPNRVGSVISMPRSMVDDDPASGCSYGLHVGTYEYASNWGPVLVKVKVNPRDVVSVPYECDCQKIRTCKYEVLSVAEGVHDSLVYRDVNVDMGQFSDFSTDDAEFTEDDYVKVEYRSHSGDYIKEFEGEIHSVYHDGYLIYNEELDEYKYIKDYRIVDVSIITGGDEEYEELLDTDYDNVAVGDLIYVEYDGGSKFFEGRIRELHSDGMLIENDGEFKHIKNYRVNLLEILEEDEIASLRDAVRGLLDAIEELPDVYDGYVKLDDYHITSGAYIEDVRLIQDDELLYEGEMRVIIKSAFDGMIVELENHIAHIPNGIVYIKE